MTVLPKTPSSGIVKRSTPRSPASGSVGVVIPKTPFDGVGESILPWTRGRRASATAIFFESIREKEMITYLIAASDASDESRASADYVCDGISDQEEINLAIAALPAGGGCIWLSEGAFLIDDEIEDQGIDNVMLRGLGDATVIRLADNSIVAAQVNQIYLTGVNSWILRDFKVDGNKANNAQVASSHAIYIYNCDYCLVENITVVDANWGSIRFEASDYCICRDCVAIDSYDTSFTFTSASSHNRFENCYAFGGDFDRAFQVRYSSSYNVITGCYVYNPPSVAFDIYAGPGQTSVHNTIENCEADCQDLVPDARTDYAVQIAPGGGALYGNRVTGCHFYNCRIGISDGGDKEIISENEIHDCDSGILVAGDKTIIRGNQVHDIGGTAADGDGIRLDTANYCIMEGNIVYSSVEHGIRVDASTYNRITGNESNSSVYGLGESGASDYNDIYDNNFLGNSGAALTYVGTNTRICNNRGYDIGNAGVDTFVVAASDAPAVSRSRADYICDGTDDQVEINAAIAALPVLGGTTSSPTGGGRILLTEGTFNLTATLDLDGEIVTLEGVGREATVLSFTFGAAGSCTTIDRTDNQRSRVVLRGMTIQGDSTNTQYGIHCQTAAAYSYVEDVAIYDMSVCGVYVQQGSSQNLFTRIYVRDCPNGFDVYGADDQYIQCIVGRNDQTGTGWTVRGGVENFIGCVSQGFNLGLQVEQTAQQCCFYNFYCEDNNIAAWVGTDAGGVHPACISFYGLWIQTCQDVAAFAVTIKRAWATLLSAVTFNSTTSGNSLEIQANARDTVIQTMFSLDATILSDSGVATKVEKISSDGTRFPTENAGTATIVNPATSVTVSHGLAVTPSIEDFIVMPTENPTADVGPIWVDTITATQFNINCRNAPGASDLDLAWRVSTLAL